MSLQWTRRISGEINKVCRVEAGWTEEGEWKDDWTRAMTTALSLTACDYRTWERGSSEAYGGRQCERCVCTPGVSNSITGCGNTV